MSEIRIKLDRVLTKEEFERIKKDLWEWFGDIGKEDITMEN